MRAAGLDPVFGFGDVLVAAFRRLTAHNWMEARRPPIRGPSWPP